MDLRDRLANLGLLLAAAVAWGLVWILVTTRDPVAEPSAGLVGAGLIGLAAGLTMIPVFWLVVFARHRRIAYRGDWVRAIRRGGWTALVVGLFVGLRVEGVFSPEIGLFVIVIIVVAEITLSVER